ncbi:MULTISPECIES: antibiotic biosynthesis monooxygenase family protein [unclassified Streptomyces]|uniref:antibiotic biosynthesis monooxygenase family protein n=1 Tax=unclassified Streptomyces TaxID=2593676 RepID=UPI00332B6BA6
MSEEVPLSHSSIGNRPEESVVLTDAMVKDPVFMINCFTVPDGQGEIFMTRWKDNVRAMAKQPGFIRSRMYRALDPGAMVSFINFVQWGSGEALHEARKNAEWRAAVQRMLDDEDLQVTPRPMVYVPALVVNAGDDV